MKRFKEFINNFKNLIRENPKLVKKYFFALIVSMLIVFFITNYIESQQAQPEEITYTEFEKLVDDGSVDIVKYSSSKEYMYAYLGTEETKEMGIEDKKEYIYPIENTKIVLYPANDTFRKDLLEKGVYVVLITNNYTFVDILSMLISVALPVIYIILLISMVRGIGMKDNDAKDIIQTSNVKFSDVIGHDEILEDVKFITELIKDPSKGENIGAKVPKGILFNGEPGTGKTLIAKAIAGEADVPFLYYNASSFIEMYVGVGAKRVRNLFKIARENAPCIVFIDEIDSIGCKRSSGGRNSEGDQTINALLQEMDGFSGREGIFIIAATNRANDLDAALTRTGRFDRQITVNPPRDWKVRKKLFEFYLGKLKVCEDVNVEGISKQTSGFTGSDIAAICNEAGIIAMMKNKEYIDNDSLEEAIDKHIFKGNRTKNKDEFKEDKKIVAYHEAGHAVMNYLLNLPISRASIISNTSGVGGVVFGADQDSCFITKDQFEDKVRVAYAGRVSEAIKFNKITTGASNDITQATQIIKSYVERYGFDDEFGLIDMSVIHQDSLIKDDNTLERVQKIAKTLYNSTEELLKKSYNLVEVLAESLLENETLSGTEITELLKANEEK